MHGGEHTPRPRMAAGLSGHLHALRATDQVCDRCAEGLGGRPADVVFLFFSSHHADAAKAISYMVRRRFDAARLIGVSAEAVIGGEVELEGSPGIAMLAASFPGVRTHTFTLDQLPPVSDAQPPDLAALARAAGMRSDADPQGTDYRATIFIADPFSVAMNTLLPALSAARPGPDGTDNRPAIIGGMASAAAKPGGNTIIIDDRILHTGAAGLSLSGNIRVDSIVSQGCRPFGPPMVVTAARNQILLSLGGKPALQALHDAIESLDEHGRELLKKGVFIGRVVNEYKDRFGRGDFLIRSVVGVDQDRGALAVADLLRVGQTVQFHLRDATTAGEDLALLLDGQKLHTPPAGAILFTCNSRGSRLFDAPHHDAAAISRAFAPEPAAEVKARGGQPIQPPPAPGDPSTRYHLPLAGLFAAGEIGPIGDDVFLHGHTASLAIFREPDAAP